MGVFKAYLVLVFVDVIDPEVEVAIDPIYEVVVELLDQVNV